MMKLLIPGALLVVLAGFALSSRAQFVAADDLQQEIEQAKLAARRAAVVAPKDAAKEVPELKAIAVIMPFDKDKSTVKGWVKFVQKGDEVSITGELTGLKPGKHGFHIHEFGDISSKDGMSTGGHYNPTKMKHGAPDAKDRHVGDLGNIVADEDGKVSIKMTDKIISLTGPNSVVGRAILIHAHEDDFSQPVGNAGGRLAAGVIGWAK